MKSELQRKVILFNNLSIRFSMVKEIIDHPSAKQISDRKLLRRRVFLWDDKKHDRSSIRQADILED